MAGSVEYDDFEQHVQDTLEVATGYKGESQIEVGQSENIWKVDCVLRDNYGLRKGYGEVKETTLTASQSTYINHMRRAYAEMGDFGHLDIPKAVVVAKKDFGRINWDAMLGSIDCLLVDVIDLDLLVDRID